MRADDNIIHQGGQLQRNESDPPRLLQSSLRNTAPATFRTEVFTSFNTDNIDAMYSAAYNTLLQKISNYQSNGSGWVVDHFIDISLGKLDV